MRFSVVILTSASKYPQKLISDLDAQTFTDFEIILSTEDGIVNAMNRALENAQGDILVRIDDDVRLTDDWLTELDKSFSDLTISGVTGPTFVPLELRKNRDSINAMDNPNWFILWLFDNAPYAPAKIYNCGSVSYGSNFEEHIEDKEYEIDYLEGTNWSVRIDLLRKIGGFDPKFDGVAEWYDTDAIFKIKKLGYKIKYNAKAIVWHMLEKTEHYEDRFAGWGRIKNWLRFHWRHSKFHYKKVIWLGVLIAYFFINKCKRFQK